MSDHEHGWTRTVHRAPDQIGYRRGPWTIICTRDDGKAVVTSGAPHWAGPIHTETVTDAMRIAAGYDVALNPEGETPSVTPPGNKNTP